VRTFVPLHPYNLQSTELGMPFGTIIDWTPESIQ